MLVDHSGIVLFFSYFCLYVAYASFKFYNFISCQYLGTLMFYHFLCSFRDGLDLVKEAIDRTGYTERIKIALDVAATEFCIGD